MTPFAPQELSTWVKERLVCPRDQTAFVFASDKLVCANGHIYPCVEGVPILLLDDIAQTHGQALEALKYKAEDNAAERLGITVTDEAVNPHVQQLVASTCGLFYRPAMGKLTRYPIPELRLPAGDDKTFLDIGSSWGRWTIAAGRKNYRCVGMDPSLGAVLVAIQVSRQLGLKNDFIVADARYLPFRSGSFDVIFSYSVIQHFSKVDARRTFADIGRTLGPSGTSLVQMPNIFGIRSLYHLVRRGTRNPVDFEVRYWTPRELKNVCRDNIGTPEIIVDGFFGLGVQRTDMDLLPLKYRTVARISEWLRRAAQHFPFLRMFADSLFLKVTRS